MASSLSDYLENKVLDHIFGGGDYARPGTLYLAAMTASPSDSGGGTEVSTSGGTSYARVAITNNGTNFPSASGRSKVNGVDFTFPTAGASWGTVAAWAIYDASTGGNLLAYATLDASQSVGTGDTLNFAAGALTITFNSGGFTDYLANKILDHVFGGGNFTRPSTLYLGAFTAQPTDAGSVAEPSLGAYARVTVTNNTSNFPNASAGSKTNGAVQSFTTASASWGTITHGGYFDSLSGGNLLWYGALSVNKAIASGQTLRLAASDLAISLD